jgi:HEPN domain-containing protein
MSDDSRKWFVYADENLAVARLALEGGWFNACLQNVQQAVEKFLKAALLFRDAGFQRTHSIEALNRQLQSMGLDAGLSDEDCDLLDTIYIPSKYPVGSVLPDFNPDYETGRRCVEIAEQVRAAVQQAV